VTGTEADHGGFNAYPPDFREKCTHSPESGGNGVNFPECGKKC
jgi:hypothetical protein